MLDNYTCTTCSTVHPFTPYLHAHIHEVLRHTCRVCGAVHSLRDYEVRCIIPGRGMPIVPMCSEQPAAGQILQVSPWMASDIVPPQPGTYECRFAGLSTVVLLEWNGGAWQIGSRRVDASRLEAWRAYVIV